MPSAARWVGAAPEERRLLPSRGRPRTEGGASCRPDDRLAAAATTSSNGARVSTAATARPPSRQPRRPREGRAVTGHQHPSGRSVRCCTATRSCHVHDLTRFARGHLAGVLGEGEHSRRAAPGARNWSRTLPGVERGSAPARAGTSGVRRPRSAVAEHQHGRDRGAGLGHRLLDGHLPEVADARHAPHVGQGLTLGPGQGLAAAALRRDVARSRPARRRRAHRGPRRAARRTPRPVRWRRARRARAAGRRRAGPGSGCGRRPRPPGC